MNKADQQYSDQDFRSIVESSQDAIMRFDRNHRHLYVNKAVEFHTGIPQQNFIGKTHEELDFPKHLCDIWAEAIDVVFDTKSPHRIEFTLPNDSVIDWALAPGTDDTSQVVSVITTARDITEIRKRNERIIENEKRFKDAFKLAKMATWEIDMVNKQVILNEEFCAIIGLDWDDSRKTMKRSEFFENLVHDDDKGYFYKSFYQAVDSRDEHYENIVEYQINKPSGETIWLHATVRVGLNPQGEVIKVYGTCQDITYIKRTEVELQAHRLHLEDLVTKRTLALKQSESKLLDAIQLANLSTWEFDIATEELRIEGDLEKKLPRELVLRENIVKFNSYIEYIDQRDFKMFYNAFEKANKAKSNEYLDILGYRMFDHNGKTRHLNLTIKARMDDGEKVGTLYGTIQDITHIITSRSENDRLNSIIEATSDIVAIFDAERSLIYLNKAGKDFYNESSDFLNDKSKAGDIQLDLCRRLLEDGVCDQVDSKGYWMGENFLRRHDGLEVPVSQIMIAHYLDTDELDCYSTIIRDISQLKKTEEDLKYKNNELDTFVYRVSHDLRGPVASMLGLYNVVKHEVTEPHSLAFFEMYNDQIIRLNETIIALIDLTRIKKTATEANEISFEEIVDGSINSFTHLSGFESVKFEKTYKLHKTYSGDKTLITTIIQNLIENAIKYSRPEVDSLVKILVEITADKEVLTINVTDNGRGIKEEIQADVFNMFFRGNHTDAIGSGLGLYILKNAVDKLGGNINLESKPNSGSSFTITIPLSSSQSPK